MSHSTEFTSIDKFERQLPCHDLPERLGTGKACPRGHEKSIGALAFYTKPFKHWHCFSCGGHWGPVRFVCEVKGLSKREAINWLSKEYDTPLPEIEREDMRLLESQDRISRAYTLLIEHATEDPEQAFKYLENRGIPREFAAGRVGYFKPNADFPGDPEEGCLAGILKEKDANGGTWFPYGQSVVVPVTRHGQVVDYYTRTTKSGSGKGFIKHSRPKTIRVKMPAAVYGLDECCGRTTKIFLVESIICAMTMQARGYDCCAAYGTQGLNEERAKLLKDDGIEHVTLVFDSETSGSGAEGAEKAGKLLFGQEIDVDLVKLPLVEGKDKEDPNSYFLNHSNEDFDALPRTSLLDLLLSKLPKDAPNKQWTAGLDSIYSLLGKRNPREWDYYAKEVNERLKTIKGSSAPTAEAIHVRIKTLSNEAKKETEKLSGIAALVCGNHKIIYSGNQFYEFEEGVYRQRYFEEIHQICKKYFVNIVHEEVTRSKIGELRFLLETDLFIRPEKLNPTGLLNCANGLLDLSEGRMKPHDPTVYSTTQTKVVVDPNAKCPLWEKSLARWLPDQANRDLLQEFFGYCLTFETKHHSALILLGDGQNGKSVALYVLEHMLGRDNCSSLTLPDIKERFRVAELQGKLVNVVYEVDSKLLISDGKWKNIVAGDPVTAEKKYDHPYKFVPTCKWVIATNKLPDSRDKSHGYFRRLMILPFDVKIPKEEQDRTLKERLVETELSGILNWALVGYARLQKQDSFTESESVKRMLEVYREEVDPILVFIRETFQHIEHGFTLLKDAYALYKSWCLESGLMAMSRPHFSKAMQKELNMTTKHTGIGDGFPGLALRGSMS